VFLCQALTEILHQVYTSDNPPTAESPSSTTSPKLKLLQEQQNEECSGAADNSSSASGGSVPPVVVQAPTPPEQLTSPVIPTQNNPPSSFCIVFLNQPLSRRLSCESELEPESPIANGPLQQPQTNVQQDRRILRTEEELFHRNLRLLKVESLSQVESVLREKIGTFKGYYGILQFLYSVILTKVSICVN
jgi:hypothetical protein